MSVLPDPATLRAVATRIGMYAEASRNRATALDNAMAAVSWHGIAAGAFGVMAHPIVGALRTSATDLDRAAAALRDLAGNVESILADLSRTGVDVVSTGSDIVTLLRDGTDPRTLVTHPGVLIPDGIRLGKDGVRIAGDALDLTGDLAHGVASGTKDTLKSLGSLAGI